MRDDAGSREPATRSQGTARVDDYRTAGPSRFAAAYVWTVETRAPATPVPSTRVSYAAGVPNTIETLKYPDPPRMERCTLRAFVDGAGNVTSTDWQGSNAGCYDAQQKLAGKG